MSDRLPMPTGDHDKLVEADPAGGPCRTRKPLDNRQDSESTRSRPAIGTQMLANARIADEGPTRPRQTLPAQGRRLISKRPADADDRAMPGHWECELTLGHGGKSQIATNVEGTNGPLRQQLPRSLDFTTVTPRQLDVMATGGVTPSANGCPAAPTARLQCRRARLAAAARSLTRRSRPTGRSTAKVIRYPSALRGFTSVC